MLETQGRCPDCTHDSTPRRGPRTSAPERSTVEMLATHTTDDAKHLSCPPLVYDTELWDKDVLQLGEGETEDELDELHALQAREAGIEADVQDETCSDTQEISAILSSLGVSSPHPSSISLHSSLSTNITNRSRSSRDTQTDASSLSAPRSTSRLSKSKLSTSSHSSYDSVIDNIRPRLPSRSASAASSAPTFSFAFGSKTKRPKSLNIRSGSLSFFRKGQSQCYSCTCHGYDTGSTPQKLHRSIRYPVATSLSSDGHAPLQGLKCGHRLTNFAIRMHIREALEMDQKIPPSCCGVPIPASVLTRVMSEAELDSLERELAISYGVDRKDSMSEVNVAAISRRTTPTPLELNVAIPPYGPLLSPIQLDIGVATQNPVYLSSPTHPLPTSPRRRSISNSRSSANDADREDTATQDQAFASLRNQQREQYSRARDFEFRQRRVIEVHYDRLRSDYWALHQQERKDIEAEHRHAIETLEEMQMDREVELRLLQDEERQNVATALKYMEAYCGVVARGALPPSEPAGLRRTVTDQDRLKLQQQYILRDGLEKKHEAAVNVLRAKQERAVQNRQKKQHEELSANDRSFEAELTYLTSLQAKDLERVEQLAASRRRRLDRRWYIKFELWRKEKGEQQRDFSWSSSTMQIRYQWPDPLGSAGELKSDAGRGLDVLSRTYRLKPSANWKVY
ncbi:hypothetical protein EJ05DRAFT_538657 [Pseudovirgaria hyperparasitica]|uniref:IBR domain-containing protein n=1 Tax=Pseudovirgaria hyperparasitica TaxID=470096 RepID=A0A6A6W4B8_9PEZI|nr:uncharacterized protein EJ05DRAFT_538657 [Pseudovirgaria hyperparasitica]KAF2757463.1 hypothetical protein EJ05DRAFT_538657 [Pseudovirgaria hyperparasitica]